MALRVLGIDPGTRVTGFAVIEARGSALALVEAGAVVPKASLPLAPRLAEIHASLTALIERVAPTHAAVEEVFFAKNVKAAIALGHARGVALAAIATAGLELFEYAPTEVKRAIVGTGKAEKEQVAHMVRLLVGPAGTEKLRAAKLDTTDACAVAICHAHTNASLARVRASR